MKLQITALIIAIISLSLSWFWFGYRMGYDKGFFECSMQTIERGFVTIKGKDGRLMTPETVIMNHAVGPYLGDTNLMLYIDKK